METTAKRPAVFWAAILAAVLGATGAAPQAASAQKSSAASNAVTSSEQDIATIDAQRGAFDRFLDAHPEIASDVAGNPDVMSDAGYLHDRPALQAFLDNHPQVKADPRAFISPRERRQTRPIPRSGLDELLGDLAPVLGVAAFFLAVLWVVRALLENRRWNRSFKMHEELHSKLIEKFASGQDFNAYLQSEGGRRLLEWTPPVLDTTSRGLPNPVGRILWSVQAGLLLFLMGLGLLLIRGHMSADDASALLVFGTLGVTLGSGFVLSALVSYGLSRRLGLIGSAKQENV